MTTVSPNVPEQKRRAPRWMWIVLVVSVALNLLVIGMAAAAILHFRNAHGGGGFQKFVQSLPVDRRDALGAAFSEQRKSMRPLRRAAREARRRARKVFAAEPFDAQALAAASAAAMDARVALNKARGDWIVTLAKQLNDDERRAYIKWRRSRWKRHGRWRRHHRRDDR